MKTNIGRGLALTALLLTNSQPCKIPTTRRAYSFFSMVACKIFIPSMASAIHLLKFGIFPLQRLEPFDIDHLHHPELLSPPVQRGHRDLFLLTKTLLAQVSTVEFTEQQDDFLRFISLLFIPFLGFGFHQIPSLKMDHFFWRQPQHRALNKTSSGFGVQPEIMSSDFGTNRKRDHLLLQRARNTRGGDT